MAPILFEYYGVVHTRMFRPETQLLEGNKDKRRCDSVRLLPTFTFGSVSRSLRFEFVVSSPSYHENYPVFLISKKSTFSKFPI